MLSLPKQQDLRGRVQAAQPLPGPPCGLTQVFWAGPASALTPLGTAGLRSLGLPVWLSQANSVLGATVVTMAPSLGFSQCKPGGELF